MSREKLVLVGNGMAGMRVVEELLMLVPDRYRIAVFGAEPYGNYNRIMLSPVLAGEKTLPEIMLNDLGWYSEHGITLHAGSPVIRIDRENRTVIAADGTVERYDRLVLATGSNPVVLSVPGKELSGVVTFRDIADVDTMLAAARSGKRRAVVIGGGLLGLEAANGLSKQGMEVIVVHLMEVLMERQMDRDAGALLKHSLEQRGLRFLLEARTEAVLGETQVTGVRFADGLEVAADLVVMAVGIRPNIELAQQAGLPCERGVLVDDAMQTCDPRIYAVGECVQHRGVTYGLVAPLWEQAAVCAARLTGSSQAHYQGSVISTRLKVTGIEVFSAGDFNGAAGSEAIVLQDSGLGVYKKLVLKENRLQGAVLYGDTADGAWYFQLLREARDVANLREHLIFGRPDDPSPSGHVAIARESELREVS